MWPVHFMTSWCHYSNLSHLLSNSMSSISRFFLSWRDHKLRWQQPRGAVLNTHLNTVRKLMLTCFNSNSFQLSGAEKLVVCYCKETYWFSIQQPGQRNKTSYVQQLHTRGRDGTGRSLYSGRSFLPFVWNLIIHQHRQEREDKTFCKVFGALPVFSPTHT